MEDLTRRTAIKAALTAAGVAATAAFLAETESLPAEAEVVEPEVVTAVTAAALVTKHTKWTFNGHKLPSGWKARPNGWASTNGVGSYLKKNAVIAHGMLTLKAIIDPTRSAAAATKWKHHFVPPLPQRSGSTTSRRRLMVRRSNTARSP